MLAAIRNNAGTVFTEVAVNIALPYAIYVETQPKIGDVHALMAASAPPIAWSVVEFVRKRRLDAVSLLAIAGIALSLLAFLGGGGVRMLQLRENLVGGLIALLFLGSAAIGKPLIYQLARAGMSRRSTAAAEDFTSRRDMPEFRYSMMVMTLVWGFGLLAQTAIACAMVFTMPIKQYLLVSPVVGYGMTGLLAGWTVWYAKRRRKLGDAIRVARAKEGKNVLF